jgi:hypothetical protein
LAYHYDIDDNRGEGGWTSVDGGALFISDVGGAGIAGQVIGPVAVCGRTEYVHDPAGLNDDRPPYVIWGVSEGVIVREVRYSISAAAGAPHDADEVRVPAFQWTGGDMPLAEGMSALLRWVKWFFAGLGNSNPLPNPVDLIVNVDSGFSITAQGNIAAQTAAPTWLIQPVRRRGSFVRLSIFRSNSFLTGWQEQAGVAGWELDVELIGKR